MIIDNLLLFLLRFQQLMYGRVLPILLQNTSLQQHFTYLKQINKIKVKDNHIITPYKYSDVSQVSTHTSLAESAEVLEFRLLSLNIDLLLHGRSEVIV